MFLRLSSLQATSQVTQFRMSTFFSLGKVFKSFVELKQKSLRSQTKCVVTFRHRFDTNEKLVGSKRKLKFVGSNRKFIIFKLRKLSQLTGSFPTNDFFPATLACFSQFHAKNEHNKNKNFHFFLSEKLAAENRSKVRGESHSR